MFNSEVMNIGEKEVRMKLQSGESTLQNDYVFIFAGGELPNEFLKKIGIQMHMQKIE